MPSPGATVQLWLQPPLLREHWSVGTGHARQLLVPLLGHCVPTPGPTLTAELALIRAVTTVIGAITELLGGQADGGVVGTGV